MQIEYIPGGSIEFKAFIDAQDKAEIRNIDGHIRWVVTREDGSEYIARPEETRGVE